MIAVILPAKGRYIQTLDLIDRLVYTAGLRYGIDWILNVIVDDDEPLFKLLNEKQHNGISFGLVETQGIGYWRALTRGTTFDRASECTQLVNLANDLLPGKDWLLRAAHSYHICAKGFDYVIGFNDGIHQTNHSTHFLIGKTLLHKWYGGAFWPVMYHHEYGDTEITKRAIEENCYAKSAYAVLYHNHPFIAPNAVEADDVYKKGWETREIDRKRFELRSKSSWIG